MICFHVDSKWIKALKSSGVPLMGAHSGKVSPLSFSSPLSSFFWNFWRIFGLRMRGESFSSLIILIRD